MAIEIRNLSITSKVVQRRPDQTAERPQERLAEHGKRPQEGWDVERRRLIAQLQDLRRER